MFLIVTAQSSKNTWDQMTGEERADWLCGQMELPRYPAIFRRWRVRLAAQYLCCTRAIFTPTRALDSLTSLKGFPCDTEGLPSRTFPVLQLAGYIQPLGHGKWRTTEQGELVGGGKAARFTRESVERAFASLKGRIQTINADESAPYRITCAVSFGDFLGDRVRVQAATVGIELKGRSGAAGDYRSTAAARREEDAFLKQLNGKSTILRLQHMNPG